MSILFSKICQFLTFYLVKSSPKNPRRKLERRRSICAGTVFLSVCRLAVFENDSTKCPRLVIIGVYTLYHLFQTNPTHVSPGWAELWVQVVL